MTALNQILFAAKGQYFASHLPQSATAPCNEPIAKDMIGIPRAAIYAKRMILDVGRLNDMKCDTFTTNALPLLVAYGKYLVGLKHPSPWPHAVDIPDEGNRKMLSVCYDALSVMTMPLNIDLKNKAVSLAVYQGVSYHTHDSSLVVAMIIEEPDPANPLHALRVTDVFTTHLNL